MPGILPSSSLSRQAFPAWPGLVSRGLIMLDLFALRFHFVLIFAIASWFFHPFGLPPWVDAAGGAAAAALFIFFEIRVRA
ncbi:MAG: hypothetical protein WA414_10650, partial [Acidobacteriaceae bacterium]